MAGCGCGGSGWTADDGLVPADSQASDYFWHGTEAGITSDLAAGVLAPTTGAKAWDPDTGRTEE